MDVLANWLWQGSAVALAATAILRASRRMSATSRYQLWWVALGVVLVLPAFSFQLPAPSFQPPHAGFEQEAFKGQPGEPESMIPAGSWKLGAGSWKKATGSLVLPAFPLWTVALLVVVWLGWAIVSLSRTLRALVGLRAAKRAARPFPAAREARLETWLSLRARGRPAALGVSDHVRAAAVLGLASPAIVVAPSALTALDDHELDQIVVHEWAHVQRRDDLARLVQLVIVALAGLHPAVWWIDRQINLERETACDDWAVNATGSARGLAICLTKLAAMPGRPADAVLLPAALLSSELSTRVVRLLDRGRNTSTRRTAGAAMLVSSAIGALALVVASVQLVETSPVAPDDPRPAALVRPAVVTAVDSTRPQRRHARFRTCHRRSDTGRCLPALRARRLAPVQARTPTSSASSALSSNSSEPPSDALSLTARLEATVPAVRPVLESVPGADLSGLGMPAQVHVTSAAPDDSGLPGGLPAGPSPTPWGVAADAGVTVGKGTQKAAVATAGFFTRLSKSITGVF